MFVTGEFAMPLILRVDVDKPFGRATILQKLLSKMREDYWMPPIRFLGYGWPAINFSSYLSSEGIRGIFFFRLCTLPTRTQLKKMLDQGHRTGLHAEDTRNDKTFLDEIDRYKKSLGCSEVGLFSKHGSGKLKLGRRHYAPYEEEKYRSWEKSYGIRFPFGNGIISGDGEPEGDFFKEMFWLNPAYRDVDRYPIEWAIEKAKTGKLPIIVHPANYYAVPTVRNDLNRLIELSREHNVEWTTEV